MQTALNMLAGLGLLYALQLTHFIDWGVQVDEYGYVLDSTKSDQALLAKKKK